MDGPLDLTNCGPLSLQRFSEEDHSHGTRKKAQHDQIELWCVDYMVEKTRALDAEQKEDDYAEYVLKTDQLRSGLEEEARRRRDEGVRLRQLKNMEYAR